MLRYMLHAAGVSDQVGVGGQESATVDNAATDKEVPGEQMALTENAAATPEAAIGDDGQVGHSLGHPCLH